MLLDEGKSGSFGKSERLTRHPGLAVVQYPDDRTGFEGLNPDRLSIWNGNGQRDHAPGLRKLRRHGKQWKKAA